MQLSVLPRIVHSPIFERRFCSTSQQPRGPVKKRQPIRANTADEAIEKMLEQKRISSKINYDVLKDLNVKPGASPRHQVETPKREPRITGRGVRTAACPLGVSKQVTLLGKRWVSFQFDAFGPGFVWRFCLEDKLPAVPNPLVNKSKKFRFLKQELEPGKKLQAL